MLNKNLKLNSKIFEADVEQEATRTGYGEGLVELGEKNPNVVVLTADLSESTKADGFEKKFPQRFFECGVAEQNMAAIAAGMGISGKIPFISSYATFSPGKNWETIRTTIIYNNSNVKIAGHHSGIITGPDGATHQATEDIAITRAWPNITVIVPCDANQAKKATVKAAEIEGPVYLRFTRDKTPVITSSDTPFDNKVQVFWTSENPQAVIFATGHILYNALLAAKALENPTTSSGQEKIHVLVANVSTIKPLDEKTVVDLVKKTGAVVTVEDHQVMGGLGGTIAEVLSKNAPSPMEFIGLQNTFAQSGKPSELMEKYKMDAPAIIEAVRKVIGRKLK